MRRIKAPATKQICRARFYRVRHFYFVLSGFSCEVEIPPVMR